MSTHTELKPDDSESIFRRFDPTPKALELLDTVTGQFEQLAPEEMPLLSKLHPALPRLVVLAHNERGRNAHWHMLRDCLTEGVGTCFFIWIISVSFVAVNVYLEQLTPEMRAAISVTVSLSFAITHGFALCALVFMTAKISGGHLNPAVTLSFMVVGDISVVKGAGYIFSQVFGAVVGSAMAAIMTPPKFHGNLCATVLGVFATNEGDVFQTIGRGFMMEFMATFVLIIVIWATAAPSKKHAMGKLAPIAIGFTLLVSVVVCAPFTGGSLNPARSIGPAIVGGVTRDLWLYILAPSLAGILGGILFKFVFFDRMPGSKDPNAVDPNERNE